MPGVRPVASSEWRVARANRHWTDEEYASRLMGDVYQMDRYAARWRTVLGGLMVAVLAALVAVALLAW